MGEAVFNTQQESIAPSGRKHKLWYPPLKQWQLYLLMVATCNIYALLWVWRMARDIRDHADTRVKPIAYSISLLLGIFAVFSSARLTWRVLSLRGGERRKHQNLPALVSLLVFLAYCFAIAAALAKVPWLYIVSVLIFPLPWMLIQSRMNEVTDSIPAADFRASAYRFSGRQIVTMCLGLVIWTGLLFALQMDFERRGGALLASSQIVEGGGGRYTIRIPSDNWYQVAPGTVGSTSSDLELFGPSIDTWAIVYLHEGVTLEEISAFRSEQSRKYGDVEYREERKLHPESAVEMSYVTYAAEDPLGRIWNWVTTAELQNSVVELIVSTRNPGEGNPRALAKSLAVFRARVSDLHE
ncbi:MAG: hypothetical protein OEN20_02620 [Gammaproteobacteria bacterium]|nr:hypothetical protein [Gammaproteobacteria bacterium]